MCCKHRKQFGKKFSLYETEMQVLHSIYAKVFHGFMLKLSLVFAKVVLLPYYTGRAPQYTF